MSALRRIDAGGQGAVAPEQPLSVVALWALGPTVPISALVAASTRIAPGRPGIGNVTQDNGGGGAARAAA